MKQLDCKFQIALVGNVNVGKSSIVNRFCNNQFIDNGIIQTIGLDYHEQIVKLNNYEIPIQIWDTAGLEINFSLTRSYYRNVDGIIMVFDVNDTKSLDDLNKEWISKIQEYSNEDIKLLVIGNKKDLDYDEQSIRQKAESLTNIVDSKLDLVSAKTGENVKEAIESIVLQLLNQNLEKEKKDKQSKTQNQDNFQMIKNMKSVMQTNITPKEDEDSLDGYVNKQSQVEIIKLNKEKKKRKRDMCC